MYGELDLNYYLAKPNDLALRHNGRFRKGHVPHNKGKKWDSYMSEEGKKKILANLQRGGSKKGRKPSGEKPVIRIDADLTKKCAFVRYKSMTEAARCLGIVRENIRNVCMKRRHFCGGYRWFYETDEEWKKYILK